MHGFAVFLVIIASLFLVSMIKIKVTAVFKNELKFYVSVLFLRFYIKPRTFRGPHSMSSGKSRKISDKLARKNEKKKARALEKKQMKSERKKEGGVSTVSFILKNLDFTKLFLEKLLKKFAKYSRVEVARLRIKIATGDAATTAVAYGAACGAANILLMLLSETRQFYGFRGADIDIAPDYLSDTSQIDMKITFSMRIRQIISFALRTLAGLISLRFRMMKSADEQK